jgi:hypothetical protein
MSHQYIGPVCVVQSEKDVMQDRQNNKHSEIDFY